MKKKALRRITHNIYRISSLLFADIQRLKYLNEFQKPSILTLTDHRLRSRALSPVAIYTSAYCTYCKRAKRLLERKGINYEEIRLDEDDEKRKELAEKLNWKTVPIIFVNGQFIGGYSELSALNDSGELDRMLA